MTNCHTPEASRPPTSNEPLSDVLSALSLQNEMGDVGVATVPIKSNSNDEGTVTETNKRKKTMNSNEEVSFSAGDKSDEDDVHFPCDGNKKMKAKAKPTKPKPLQGDYDTKKKADLGDFVVGGGKVSSKKADGSDEKMKAVSGGVEPSNVLALLKKKEQETSALLSRVVANVNEDEEPLDISSMSYQGRVDEKVCIIQNCTGLSFSSCFMCRSHYYKASGKANEDEWAKILAVTKSISRMTLQAKLANTGDSYIMRLFSIVDDNDILGIQFLGANEDGFEVDPEDDKDEDSILVALAQLCNLRGPKDFIAVLMKNFDFTIHESSPIQLQWNNKLPQGWDGKTGIKLRRSSNFRKGQQPFLGHSASALAKQSVYNANTRNKKKQKDEVPTATANTEPKKYKRPTCTIDDCTHPNSFGGLCSKHQPQCSVVGCSNKRAKLNGLCTKCNKQSQSVV